jgi:hypothetical protein
MFTHKISTTLNLKMALERHFRSNLTQKPDKPECNKMYDIKAMYHNRAPYWFLKLRSDCVAKEDREVMALLFCHEIVDDIIAKIDTDI